MTEQLAKVIDIFKPPMSVERKAHLIQRAADMTTQLSGVRADIADKMIEEALLDSELRQVQRLLNERGEDE